MHVSMQEVKPTSYQDAHSAKPALCWRHLIC